MMGFFDLWNHADVVKYFVIRRAVLRRLHALRRSLARRSGRLFERWIQDGITA